MSTWHPTRLLTGYGWDAITAGCLLGPRPPANLLLLGLGGGTIVGQLLHLLPELQITAIDLDPYALSTAQTNLGALADRIRIVQGDAYAWVRNCPTRFDVIVDDIYASGPQDVFRPVPLDGHLTALLASKLTADGILVANLVLGPGHRKMHSLARAGFRANFPQMRSVRPPRGYNVILVGGRVVQPPASLRQWSAQWPPADRRWWERLRVGS